MKLYLFDLAVYDTVQIPRDVVDEKLILKHRVLPLIKRGHTLFVATSNPTNIEALEAVRFNSKLNIEVVIVEHDKLQRTIEQNFSEESNFDFGDEELNIDVSTSNLDEDDSQDNAPQEEEAQLLNILTSYW